MNNIKVLHITEIDTEEWFNSPQFCILGDDGGNWFVVHKHLYSGRYRDRYRAEEHAEMIREVNEDLKKL